jgi:hypothetical protein
MNCDNCGIEICEVVLCNEKTICPHHKNNVGSCFSGKGFRKCFLCEKCYNFLKGKLPKKVIDKIKDRNLVEVL